MTVLPFPVEAVIFDMDGLLLDTEQLYRKAFIAAASRHGFVMSETFYQKMVGPSLDECFAIIAAHFGREFPLADYKRDCLTGLEELVSAGIPVKPGAQELLDEVARRGLPSAVATSTMRTIAEDHLRRAGVLQRCNTVVTRDDVERGKPAPDLFLQAARTLGVGPQRCLVLEDSHHGIRAAHAAGAMPVMVPDLLEATADVRGLCVAVLRDLHEAIALLPAR